MTNFVPVLPGDRVILRKPHPCGSYSWSVTRIGADIGLQCSCCGRRVMLAREEFERRVKSIEHQADTGDMLRMARRAADEVATFPEASC